MENRGIMATLRSHKNNNMGLVILFFMSIYFIGINLVEYINDIGFNFSAVILLLVLSISSGLALYFEYRKQSVVAHLIFFVLMLEPFLRTFYNLMFSTSTVEVIYFLKTLIGAIASIYVIMKIIAHNNEIKTYVPQIKRSILVLLVIVLINQYLMESIYTSLIYALFMITAIFTGGGKMSLPIVFAIYLQKTVLLVEQAYIFRDMLTGSMQFNMIINAVIYVLIMYYTVKLLREEDSQIYYS